MSSKLGRAILATPVWIRVNLPTDFNNMKKKFWLPPVSLFLLCGSCIATPAWLRLCGSRTPDPAPQHGVRVSILPQFDPNLLSIFVKLHHFYAAPDVQKILYEALAPCPPPTLLYSKFFPGYR
jgi:hypothetical protein